MEGTGGFPPHSSKQPSPKSPASLAAAISLQCGEALQSSSAAVLDFSRPLAGKGIPPGARGSPQGQVLCPCPAGATGAALIKTASRGDGLVPALDSSFEAQQEEAAGGRGSVWFCRRRGVCQHS